MDDLQLYPLNWYLLFIFFYGIFLHKGSFYINVIKYFSLFFYSLCFGDFI